MTISVSHTGSWAVSEVSSVTVLLIRVSLFCCCIFCCPLIVLLGKIMDAVLYKLCHALMLSLSSHSFKCYLKVSSLDFQ